MSSGAAACDDRDTDAVIIGAGVNGAAIGRALSIAGYRVRLVDQADIGAGTSQASTMMVWGGLLYLRQADIRAVLDLSRDRDRLISTRPDLVRPQSILYVPGIEESSVAIRVALEAYWALAAGRRSRPHHLTQFPEQVLFATPQPRAYTFEEATILESDARFVLALVQDAERCGARVQTYTRVDSISSHRDRTWRLGLTDVLNGQTSEIEARCVLNAAGGWTDAVNARAGIRSPWRHTFSRGVSITVPRDAVHTRHIVVGSRIGEALTLAPWGPVALWASTDTVHADLAEARRSDSSDIEALLEEYNRHFHPRRTMSDVISRRVGVRALPVKSDSAGPSAGVPSRHHRIHADPARGWISIYGGKISGCLGLAAEVQTQVERCVAPRVGTAAPPPRASETELPDTITFPGVAQPVVTTRWAIEHEHCRTLDDYLRRRTNIAQWIPCGGFGRHGEHTGTINTIALELCRGDHARASDALIRYRQSLNQPIPMKGLEH